MNRIKYIYSILSKTYGPQKWWPTTFKGELHPRYHGNAPTDKQKFEIIIGAILTQNTSWNNVEKAIINLNKEDLIDPVNILDTKKSKLAALIRPSGYFNQKAERLKIISRFYLKNKDPSREQLLSVKGIGPETADSILLYAFNKPFFVIDSYTKKLFSRLNLCNKDISYDDLQSIFYDSLDHDPSLFNEYHALIVQHSKQFCKNKPLCNNCPLTKICEKLI